MLVGGIVAVYLVVLAVLLIEPIVRAHRRERCRAKALAEAPGPLAGWQPKFGQHLQRVYTATESVLVEEVLREIVAKHDVVAQTHGMRAVLKQITIVRQHRKSFKGRAMFDVIARPTP